VNPLFITIGVFACVFGGAVLGMYVSPLLPVHQQSSESKDIVRLGMGLVATTVAVVLGLLISSAKSFYDTQCNEVTQLAANIVMLDRSLAHYGPDAADARAALRTALGNQLDSPVSRDRSSKAYSTIKSGARVGEGSIDKIQELSPKNDNQRSLKAQTLSMAFQIGQTRWLMFEQNTVPVPRLLLAMLILWLIVLFLSFGIFAPRNLMVLTGLFSDIGGGGLDGPSRIKVAGNTTPSHDPIAIQYDSGRITQTIQRRREMRMARLITGLILALVCVYLPAQPSEQKIAATGKLVRAMAIGGESTGWILELESAVTIDGKPWNSILVSYRKTEKLEKLENARVSVTGKIEHRHEVEKGEHLVLDVSSIKEAKVTAQPAPAQPVSLQNITTTGKLMRAMAIGGESTGWILELDSTTTIDGKQVNSIQVSYRNIEKLEKLENERVSVTGKIIHRHGVETGEHLVLDISSIKEAKATTQPAPAQPGLTSPIK
jgi:hypothetical protein